MAPFSASRHRYRYGNSICGCRRAITQGAAAFTAEAFVRLDRSAAFWAGDD
jgi:hypothetical protein